MTGVCGWMGPLPLDGAPQRLIDQMTGAVGSGPGQACTSIGTGYGIAATSPFGLASIHREEGLLAAVDGRIHWDAPDLARMAQDISPAAALALAYRRHGTACLTMLHGPFSLAVIEPAAGTALLAIDRMGIHRMCFAHRPGGLVFGSHCDAVVRHPAVARNIDPQAVFNYLYSHMVPAPGSIYQGVEKLLPGQFAVLRNGRVSRDFYWEAEWEDDESGDFEARTGEFRQLLERCVSDVLDRHPTGTFLSGGTDSSTVSGMFRQVTGEPAETFSIGFEAENFDEIEYARIAVNRFRAHPHEYYVTPDDVVRTIPLIAATYDEPFGNASAVPTYYCALRAKEAGIEVMLAGDGGDEIFGGNARYAKQKVFETYWKIPAAVRKGLIEPVLLNLPGAKRFPPARKAQSYVQQARIPLPDRLETYNFLNREPLESIFEAAFLRTVNPDEPAAIQREAYFRTRSRSPINRMLHLDWKHTLADSDLVKVGRMCEAAGVEVRYPLLDERMVAFAAKLPPSYKVRGYKLRWFFKEALKDFLPQEIIHKSKHGFGLPFGLWMQHHAPLHELAHASLNAFRERGYLREDYLDRLIDVHRSGHATYYGVMIWVVMMLEQWFQSHEFHGGR